MTLTIAILVIILGIILVLAEVFVIPGVGIVGVIGLMLIGVGVYGTYNIDTTYGHITLAFTSVVCLVLAWIAFQAKTWDRLSVRSELSGKVNTFEEDEVKVGEIGVSVSRLAPMGKARINNKLFEVKSLANFIDEGEEVKVIRIDGSQIIVKLNTSEDA